MNGNERYDVGDASLIQELIVKGIEPLRSWDLSLNDINNNNKLDSGRCHPDFAGGGRL